MEPLLPLKQLTSVWVSPINIAGGSETVSVSEAWQPFASLTVTLYVPAISPALSSVVGPSFQLKVYGAVPPLTVISIEPLFPSLQLTSACVPVTASAPGCVIVTVCELVQACPSLTVTVYVPAERPVRFWVVGPSFHTNV
jgi:hypothetical protein